nr:YfjI family protein [Roseicella aerolata]
MPLYHPPHIGRPESFDTVRLWTWPDPRPFSQPRIAGDAELAVERLQRLADLAMAQDAEGNPTPSYVPLVAEGREVLTDFASEMQRREHGAHGLMKSSLGKARGQALRLALILEYLWWTANPAAPEPAVVSVQAMQAAAGLMDAYFLPMAARVLSDASIPEAERNARTLAQHIVDTRPELVNVSSIRDDARLPGLRETEPVKAACRFLAEAGWLQEPVRTGSGGRPRGDWRVNPKIWEAVR